MSCFQGAKVRISEKKTKSFLSFLEREYLRPKVKVRISEKKTKSFLSFLEREYLRPKVKGTT